MEENSKPNILFASKLIQKIMNTRTNSNPSTNFYKEYVYKGRATNFSDFKEKMDLIIADRVQYLFSTCDYYGQVDTTPLLINKTVVWCFNPKMYDSCSPNHLFASSYVAKLESRKFNYNILSIQISLLQ